ncbi:MAG: hypothetical protein C4326_14585 [Ignavibacteria bacterium]
MFVAALADTIFVPFAAEKSKTLEFAEKLLATEHRVVTLQAKENAHLISRSAKGVESVKELISLNFTSLF